VTTTDPGFARTAIAWHAAHLPEGGGETMSVLVQFIVKVGDVDRFVAASEKYAPLMQEMGGRMGAVYEDENEPGVMSTISEWDDHDQMHAASEKYGDAFNEEAGTAGLEWTTHIWSRKGSA
jgi:quinol monooxygenase YgiN